ncbi:ribonuclease J [archaeon]|nr:ribonuclease J [archaeon]
MEIEIFCLGGYTEIGKNMTAIKVGDEVVILDMGIHLEKIIGYEEEIEKLNTSELMKIGAIPNDKLLDKLKDKVKAIAITHAHLDHSAAVPYMSKRYKNATIMGTPYTIEILNRIAEDKKIKIRNKVKVLNVNSSIKVSDNIKIEFINMTHSTLQTVMIAVHTPKGVVLYANDFKFDNNPTLGKKPNFKRLKELEKENVLALIVDSTNAQIEGKTPSEKVAREMLGDVLFGTENHGKGIVVTTFSSQIARLKSIVEFGKRLDRKVVLLGRSLFRYVTAAEKLKLVKMGVEVIGFKNLMRRKLQIIERNRGKYMIVCTGNQGEPGSTLVRLADDELPFKFKGGDHVVFSCRTIPSPINVRNREELESKLKKKGARLFKRIHQSGHASKEDLRDLIEMTRPLNVIPAHGNKEQKEGLVELCGEMGYDLGKNVHMMANGKKLII